MRGGRRKGAPKFSGAGTRPMIVFHGDADATVHLSNAAQIVHFELGAVTSSVSAPALRGATITRGKSAAGVDAELWTIHGAPHAWAGGSQRASYTDPSGPDASAALLSCASAGRNLVMRDAFLMVAADLSANQAFGRSLFEIFEPGQQARRA
jgi:hypothetical protein